MQRYKSIIGIIITTTLLLFICIQIGLNHNDSFGIYESIKNFEQATSIDCLELYDIYDYIDDERLTFVSHHNHIIKSSVPPIIDYKVIDNDTDCSYRIMKGSASGALPGYDNTASYKLSMGDIYIGDKEHQGKCYINVIYKLINEGYKDIYIEFDIRSNDLSKEEVDQKICNYMEEVIKTNSNHFIVK